MPEVEDLPVAGGAIEERHVKALEDQAAASKRQAEATERIAGISIAVGAPLVGNPKAERFERLLVACVQGRVATNVEGFLSFARELADGIDREFPAEPAPAP